MVSSEKNATYLDLRDYLGQKKRLAQNYIFIAILCAKIAITKCTFQTLKQFTDGNKIVGFKPIKDDFLSGPILGVQCGDEDPNNEEKIEE